MNRITHYFKSLLLLELLAGLWLTLKYSFKPKYTMMYPMEKFPQSPRTINSPSTTPWVAKAAATSGKARVTSSPVRL